MTDEREFMEYDVVIVGAGPSGLSAAIRLKQLSNQHSHDLSVCVIEKGAEIGAHILSGAILEPRALDELIPDWKALGAPIEVEAGDDHFVFLTQSSAIRLPTPPQMHNRGNYIISLGRLTRWLGEQAEALGVEIYPGFAAAEILYSEDGSVKGIATGDMGVDKNGERLPTYEPGMELRSAITLFAEGCRGHLTQQLCERFNLRKGKNPQTYGIGIKEIWEVDSPDVSPGKVWHSVGWPLDTSTYGGSFLYHLNNNQVAVGFVVGLDYQNPYLSPFEEFQRFKTHPAVKPLLTGGRRVAYGARALSEGGLQSIPELVFPGGLLVGDAAGFLNTPKIKGIHTSMKSGMVAAETVFEHLSTDDAQSSLDSYTARLQQSWLWEELYRARNIRPAFRWGLWPAIAYSGIDTYLFRGRAPWTLNHHADHDRLKPADQCQPIDYPKPDGVLTFDRNSSVFLANTSHEENQPCHLVLKEPSIAVELNYKRYAGPEERFCPAGVYEFIETQSGDGENPTHQLQINAANCIHCKTCDIKDYSQNITWVSPLGGNGPNYEAM